MSKLQDKLSRLLALATLKEGEADNDARVNEARTASFLLLKTCQDNGVKIRFVLPAEKREPAFPREPMFNNDARPQGPPVDFGNFVQDFFRNQQRTPEDAMREAVRREEARREEERRAQFARDRAEYDARQARAKQEAFKRPKAHRSHGVGFNNYSGPADVFIDGVKVGFTSSVSYHDTDDEAEEEFVPGWTKGVKEPMNHPMGRCVSCQSTFDVGTVYLLLTRPSGDRSYFHPRCSKIGRDALGL